jgi:hypothetical protein
LGPSSGIYGIRCALGNGCDASVELYLSTPLFGTGLANGFREGLGGIFDHFGCRRSSVSFSTGVFASCACAAHIPSSTGPAEGFVGTSLALGHASAGTDQLCERLADRLRVCGSGDCAPFGDGLLDSGGSRIGRCARRLGICDGGGDTGGFALALFQHRSDGAVCGVNSGVCTRLCGQRGDARHI